MRKTVVLNTFAVLLSLMISENRADTLESLAETCAPNQDLYSMGYCTGYLGAIVDSLNQEGNAAKEKHQICFGDITNQMLLDAVIEGVAQHPDLKPVVASQTLIQLFQESFPCDPKRRAAIIEAKMQQRRSEFLDRCARLPIEPRNGTREAACVCMIDQIAAKVDLTSGNHASNADYLFETEAKDLEREIAEYPENAGFNSIGLDRLYMKALATCF